MSLLLLLVSIASAANVTDTPNGFLVDIAGMAVQNKTTKLYTKQESFIQAVYLACGVALRGRLSEEDVTWPEIQDGSIEANSARFLIFLTHPRLTKSDWQCVRGQAQLFQ